MESISPAIHINTEKQLKELSPEEFQQMLSAWFNEKGVLRDMKSYLKYQMINVLKHTALGKHINSTAYQAHTLAQQALHLIVAEYLLQQECHFSLSLFSTEVNLSSILPDIKLFFDSENESKVALKKFHKQNLVNILELLGISKENPYYKIIINEYFSKTSVSILGCLLSVIGNNIKKQTKEQDLKINPYQKSKSSSSSRSQSITEEILHEARQKLRLLEEESEELDIRFQKFCIA
ncbi:uncharacterized protein LOC126744653 isoform X3 [Anthonomus grandis grandis]|uniref:uncharacterized protein LOC126744653 isoform X3 n=1 Tax=Anthonomus grandis grandis TaxID=2921223 RepID=UPI0021667585|nr:uncharacterized protein LOC126744653 isoform X3 [Anthonomus grandis grandis]